MITAQQLEQFGLSQKEARVYLAALQLGPASVQTIAKQAAIHRVVAHEVLRALIDKGLINQTVRGKKRMLEAVDPTKIYQSLTDKQMAFINLLPELQAVQNKGQKKPKVMYFEGKENVWKAYLDRIRHEGINKENLVYGTSTKIMTIFPEGYKEFTKERIRKGIKARIIVEKSAYSVEEARKGKAELREVKFLPDGKAFKCATIIYGNRVMTVSWESMVLVIIEDQANADNQRFVWEMLWNSLK